MPRSLRNFSKVVPVRRRDGWGSLQQSLSQKGAPLNITEQVRKEAASLLPLAFIKITLHLF
jgi:hypothetical protein